MGRPDQPRGPDGRWVSRGGSGVVAVVVALVVALVSGAGVTGASGLGEGGSAGRATGTTKGHAKARDRDPLRTVLRLERQGLRVEQRLTSDDGACAAHSYGRVQVFFGEQPCTALVRALFEVRDDRRNVVLVAVAWVAMPDATQARRFQRLVDRDGTGNITELSWEHGRYRAVRFSGDYYESVRDDETVVNAQAQTRRPHGWGRRSGRARGERGDFFVMFGVSRTRSLRCQAIGRSNGTSETPPPRGAPAVGGAA